jgi:hypothetical protein
MGSRWLGTMRGSSRAHSAIELPLPDRPAPVAWRAWLATGARRVKIDRRRARGADAHLKKILMGEPSGAADFTSAMARHGVDEAMRELPSEHEQVVKLAYFGGLTNGEIARELGLTVGGVRRRLRESLAIVSAQVERGRAAGRRAVHNLVLLLYWPRLGAPGVDQVVQTGVVAVMTAVAAAMLVTHHSGHPSPGHFVHPHRSSHTVSVGSVGGWLVDGDGTTAPTATAPLPSALAVVSVPRAAVLESIVSKVLSRAVPPIGATVGSIIRSPHI